MREIKVRAYDPIEKEFHYGADKFKEGISSNRHRLDKFFRLIMGNYLNTSEYQQYVGLEDKNGKEIYEGDILRYDNHKCFVFYEDGQYHIKRNGTLVLFKRQIDALGLEVVGNIFENKELV